MNLTTETYAVIPKYTQEVMDMTMDFLYQEEDRDHLWPHNLEYYIRNINDWLTVSFYKRGGDTVGFACAQEYPGGARLMSRMFKSPLIRNLSKIPLTKATKEIVKAQYDLCEQMGIYYAFMSREHNPKSFINYSDSFDWCKWSIPEKRYLVGTPTSRNEKSSWQYIMYNELNEDDKIDDYLESITEEEYNETFKT